MITQALCNSYKSELLRGVHQPDDRYRMALYTSQAELSAATSVYTPDGEVSGEGYEPGGRDLRAFVVTVTGGTAILDWAEDPVWPVSSLTARAALIYNATRGNRALAVLDFREDITSRHGPFTVTLPPATPASGLIRVG